MYHHNEKNYACFVDFKKAFDSVWHDGLLFKLLQIDVVGASHGCFFNLIKSLYSNSTCSIKIGQNQTGPLPYARRALQNCLNTLSSYCSTWLLSINPNKTKVMIFQKRAKKNDDANFHIDNEPVEIVQNYAYLGTIISSTGNFSLALGKLKNKALHALFSLRKHTNLGKLSPFLASKIRRNDLPNFDIQK